MKMGAFLKNFKTHKKLNLFKCPKFYRTNCDLLMISVFVQVFLLLVTVINCSEFNLISSSAKYSESNKVNHISSNQRNSSKSSLNQIQNSFSETATGLENSKINIPSLILTNSASTTNLNLLLTVNRTRNVNNDNIQSSDNSNGIDNKRLIVVRNQDDRGESHQVHSNLSNYNINRNSSSRNNRRDPLNYDDPKRLNRILSEDAFVNNLSVLYDNNNDNTVMESSKDNKNNHNTRISVKNDTISGTDDEDEDDENDELNAVKLQQIIMQGLGLKSLPDASKMNISQEEYETKYNEYLARVRERKKRELLQHYNTEYLEEVLNPLTLYSIRHNASDTKTYKVPKTRTKRSKRATDTSHHDVVYVRFPIDLDSTEVPGDIEEATLRLLLNAKQRYSHDLKHQHHHHHHHRHRPSKDHPNAKGSETKNESQNRVVTLKVYQLIEPYGRVWLDSRAIQFDEADGPLSRWIELDVSKAVDSWLVGKQSNLGLEIVCDDCHEYNVFVMDDTSSNSEPDFSPVLNIVGRFGVHREKRSRQHHHFMQASRRKPRKTDCVQENNKCCRHKMEVVFSEIKGYDFIIQPKTFDAGYCRGRCPPRYNPAHQHAFFQSLIWKQDKSKVPRPCCAPSKLAELEVLHVDEKNKNKLQVSTWKDMRVQECACS